MLIIIGGPLVVEYNIFGTPPAPKHGCAQQPVFIAIIKMVMELSARSYTLILKAT